MTDDPSAPGVAGTVEVAELERACYATWTASDTTEIDGWILRANGGFTRRLNSATTIGRADVSERTRELVRGWLADRGTQMTVRMTPLVDPFTRAGVAETWGLAPEADTYVLAKDITGSEGGRGSVAEVDPSDPSFVTEVFALNDRDPRFRSQWEGIVERLGGDGVGLWRPGVAVALAAVNGPTAYAFSVAVHPDSRRRGIATDVMRAAEGWAGSRGATTIALQVTGANVAAQALYHSLGYTTRYAYTYLEPPTS